MNECRSKLKPILLPLLVLVMGILMLYSDVTCQAATKVAKVKGVEAESKSYNSVTVTWNSVKKATGYQVYRSTSKRGKYKKVDTVKKNEKLKITDKKLTTGQTYYYKVRAYYKKGSKVTYGAYSAVAKVKPVPAKTTVTSVTSVSYNSVKVAWKSVSGASGYEVYRSMYKDGKNPTLAKTVSGKSKVKAEITGLGTGRTYYFWVRPYRTVKGKKVYGPNSAKAKGASVPAAPEIVSVQLESKSSATLTWKYVSGSDGYYIYRSTSKNSGYKKIATIKSKNTKEYLDESITAGTTYYYKVVAYRTFDGKKVNGDKSKQIQLKTTSTYTISPTSKPYAGNYLLNANYNSSTRNYFTILSYMELFEKLGGGELVLNSGSYQLWKPIYIPSNTTIRFKDGVTITSTGTSGSYGLFVLADPSIMEGTKKYSKYNGAHDIKLIGEGTVTFDKKYTKHSALLIGHTKNVTIDNITFKNMNGGAHFIELDASQNVLIQNCTFTGYKDTSEVKEAINIDTPDDITHGFSGTYSSMDKTPNKDITICNNVFNKLPVAIGTHMYSTNYQHDNIQITGNTIKNCKYYGIRAMNWKNSSIKNNTIQSITGNTEDESLAIEMRGVSKVVVKDNKVSNSDRFMIIKVASYSQSTIDSHPGLEDYAPVYNDVSESDVVYNTLSNVKCEYDIYYANTLDFSDRTFWTVK